MESVCVICGFKSGDAEEFNGHMRDHTPAPPPVVLTEEQSEEETREVVAAELAETVRGLGDEFVSIRVEIGKVWAETAKQDSLEAVSASVLALGERVAALESLAKSLIESQLKTSDTPGE